MKNTRTISSTSAWVMPATGVLPPFFTFAAVRAMAPVAGIPPNSTEPMLPTPCATSSMLLRWCELIMLSATTQDRSDSIAARMAMVMPLGSWSASRSTLSWGMRNSGRSLLMTYRSPMVLTCMPKPLTRAIPHDERDKGSGDAFADLRPGEQDGEADRSHDERLPVGRSDALGDGLQLVHSLDRGRAGGEGEAEEVFELPNDEGHGDARRKARGDGVGDEPDERSQLEEAHQHEQHAGDDGGCDEAVHAVGCHDACNDGGERRRGAPRSARGCRRGTR